MYNIKDRNATAIVVDILVQAIWVEAISGSRVCQAVHELARPLLQAAVLILAGFAVGEEL